MSLRRKLGGVGRLTSIRQVYPALLCSLRSMRNACVSTAAARVFCNCFVPCSSTFPVCASEEFSRIPAACRLSAGNEKWQSNVDRPLPLPRPRNPAAQRPHLWRHQGSPSQHSKLHAYSVLERHASSGMGPSQAGNQRQRIACILKGVLQPLPCKHHLPWAPTPRRGHGSFQKLKVTGF